MCIAAIISKPISLEYLKSMQSTNPDGAGVAWLDPASKAIQFVRGLSPIEIYDMQSAGQMTFPYLLHFRWATIGIEDHTNIHPFPVGEQTLLGERSGSAQAVLMHNGTWGGYNKYIKKAWDDEYQIPDQKQLDGMSDTAVAAWLCPMYPEILDEVQWSTALAIAGGDDGWDIQLRGNWTEYEGNQYSNLGWLPWSLRTNDLNRNFWKSYAKSKGWAWSDDSTDLETIKSTAVTSGSTDYDSRYAGMDWEEYLEAKYGSEFAADVRQDKLVNLEEADSELIERQIAEELRDEPYIPDMEEYDLVSEDPELVNSWLASRMIA